MPPPSDRALRRQIAQLASLAPQDIEAILDQMEPARRQNLRERLQRYLDEIHGRRDATVNRFEPPPGLSSWLAARARASGQDDQRTFGDLVFGTGTAPGAGIAPFRMTPHAISALRNAAAASATFNARSGASPAGDEPGLFQRLRSALATAVAR